MNETAFGRWLSTNLFGTWIRVENSVSSGMPDMCVLFHGNTHWVELKVGEFADLRPAQYVWHKRAIHQLVSVTVILLQPNDAIVIWKTPYEARFRGKYWRIISAPMFLMYRTKGKISELSSAIFSSSI